MGEQIRCQHILACRYSYSGKIWASFYSIIWLNFGQLWKHFGLLFIPTSGHTDPRKTSIIWELKMMALSLSLQIKYFNLHSRPMWPDWAIFESSSWWHGFYQTKPKCKLNFWAKVKSNTFHDKLLWLVFRQILEKLGYFLIQDLVTLSSSTTTRMEDGEDDYDRRKTFLSFGLV